MKFKDYRIWQAGHAIYAKWEDPVPGTFIEPHHLRLASEERKLQAIMEMVGEAGEVLQVATKARRKGLKIPREKILDELGDTFWGLTGVLNEFDISLEELMEFNHEKLEKRNS